MTKENFQPIRRVYMFNFFRSRVLSSKEKEMFSAKNHKGFLAEVKESGLLAHASESGMMAVLKIY